MSFMQNMKQALNNEYNTAITENGAVAYRTSGKALLDLNFAVSSFRNKPVEELIDKFIKAYYEDPSLALRWMFFVGDIRQGLGERRIFKTLFLYLAQNHIKLAKALMHLIPEYSRWDIVVSLMDTELADKAVDMIQKQLQEDGIHMEKGESISLCAKWLPSENASSNDTKRMARKLAKKLSMTSRQYRQILSSYRRHLNIVEIMMSDRKWAEIDYETVSSRANLIYNTAFLRNDEVRRREFLGAVKKGEKKIHAGVLYPHDIVHKYFERNNMWNQRLLPRDDALEELWKALPDCVQGNGNTLCVADGSGSMMSTVGNTTISCLDVANALAIYFSEHCRGQFQNSYITFSERPQFVDLSKGKTLHDKIEIALHYNEVANTNIEAVFDLILDTAVKKHMPMEELPANILILSDMEFDAATGTYNNKWVSPNEKLFDTIAKRYAKHGYRLPRLVFWNICSRTNAIPVKENALGVALISGFSPVIVKMVLSNEINPYKMLVEQLTLPRYDAVGIALETIGI